MSDARVVRFGPLAALDDELDGISYDLLLKEPPPQDWMVEDCFLKGTVAIISGNGGAGKSTLMQQLATHAVLGLNWLGLRLQAGKALMLACEDPVDEIRRRQWAINKSIARHMEDVLDAGLDLIPRAAKDNVLMEIDRPTWRMKRTDLMHKLWTRCRRRGWYVIII